MEPWLLIHGATCGISKPFGLLFPTSGQVTYVLRTHSPLRPNIAIGSAFDLHVLSTPPAFILSQDQTLRKNCFPAIHQLGLGDLLLSQARLPRARPDAGLTAGTPSAFSLVLPITAQLLRCRIAPGCPAPEPAEFITPHAPCQERHKSRCGWFPITSAARSVAATEVGAVSVAWSQLSGFVRARRTRLLTGLLYSARHQSQALDRKS